MRHLATTALIIGIAGLFVACSLKKEAEPTGEGDKAEAQTQAAAPPPAVAAESAESAKAPTSSPSASAPIRSKSSELDDLLGAPSPSAKKSAAAGARRSPSPRSAVQRPEPRPDFNTESYANTEENAFTAVDTQPLSTFSVDVDTASYANVRRMLKAGNKPPAGAVRIEEMINYFDYNYPNPKGKDPFSTHVELSDCPWNKDHLIAKIGLKGKPVRTETRQPANLVFLLDVSGSMRSANKLPLLQKALKMAVNQLGNNDRVAIVVYAGASGMVLPSTSFQDRQRILEALDQLQAGGSTNAGQGIELAYNVAAEHFVRGGINRVILATDGDFNVGITNRSDMTSLIEKMAKKGIFLTVLGLGMGNLKDDMLETLADKGNGNYAYIDNFQEARKVFSEQINGTLMTIAKDVKIQVEFNPYKVGAYRLIGYENRMLAARDFNDDTKDAGEIGAGHTVTALYEIAPRGKEIGADMPDVDPLKYQQPGALTERARTPEWMTVKIRYKQPDEDTGTTLEFPIKANPVPFRLASADFRFAAATAGFGMLLKDSKHKGTLTYNTVEAMADAARGQDRNGYRAEMVQLIRAAESLAGHSKPALVQAR